MLTTVVIELKQLTDTIWTSVRVLYTWHLQTISNFSTSQSCNRNEKAFQHTNTHIAIQL